MTVFIENIAPRRCRRASAISRPSRGTMRRVRRLLPLLHALGLVGPFARDGVGLVIERVHLEAGDAEFLAHEGGGGGEVAPQARLAGALCGDGALQGAVAHQHGPAAGLAEDGRAANSVGLDEALDGLSVDSFGLVELWPLIAMCFV